MATRLKRANATGLVQAGPCWLKSVELTAGAGAAATASVQDSATGGGSDMLGLAAPANKSSRWRSGDREGTWISNGIYVSALSGAGASVAFEIE